METSNKPTSTPIAIVGMGFRLPGDTSTPTELLAFLEHHGDAVRDIPSDRWSVGRFYSVNESTPGRLYVKRAAFLTHDIFSMDPAPFSLSPRECQVLDPQQRLLLESAWDAIEDAGIPITQLAGSNTGVYVGGFMQDIRDIAAMPENQHLVGSHSATGTTGTILSNRLSYTFDWHGPSFSLDTACSSSLVAVHLACRDLGDNVCDLALAGGVNVMLSPASMLIMCKGQFLARDGRSKSFDAAADGYGRGEGGALIVLKRLSDAVRDCDRIYATILATGINQDGRTAGMALPNGAAQVSLARQVSALAGINPRRLGYLEAHGTGTRAGDTTEAAALGEVYGGVDRLEPLMVGSIKSNIGHLEAAAGVAGLIKTALSLHHRRILPLRALETPNPEINFKGLGIQIPLDGQPWPEGSDLTAAVNSFGYGGTNAHAVLTVAPESSRVPCDVDPPEHVRFVPISAFDDAALAARALQFSPLVEPHFDELASTLAHHRAHLSHRAVALATRPTEVVEALEALANGQPHPRLVRDRAEVSRLCCVYTGMGPQWWGMGRELFSAEPVFRAVAERIDATFSDLSGWSILNEVLAPEASSKIAENLVAQPGNFLLQVALTELLRHYGVKFEAYLGHSVGELSAAWASGCLSLEQATETVFHRSTLQQRVAGRGTMLAVALSLEAGEELCRELDDVSVAAINGNQSIVLAGGHDALVVVDKRLQASGVFSRFMRVEVAYHSAHMDPLESSFLERLSHLHPASPQAPLFSTTYGVRLFETTHDASYWWKNARMPVLLQPALHAAFSEGFDGFLEVGPHPVLAPSILGCAREAGISVKALATLTRGETQTTSFYRSIAALHCCGVDVNWERLAPRTQRITLPPYPFQRKRYWQESEASIAYRLGRTGAHPFLDQRKDTEHPEWEVELDDTRFSWLEGHRVQGPRVFPGAAYLEIGFAVSQEFFGSQMHVLSEVEFSTGLVIPDDEAVTIGIALSKERVIVSSRTASGWQSHATFRLLQPASYRVPASRDIQTLISQAEPQDISGLYARLGELGLQYSGDFHGIQRLWQSGNTTVAEISAQAESPYLVFPAALDAAFQALLYSLDARVDSAIVPVRARSVRCIRRATGTLFAVCQPVSGQGSMVFDVELYNAEGEVVVLVHELVFAPIEKSEAPKGAELNWLHGKEWIEVAPEVRLHVEQPLYLVGRDVGSLRWLHTMLADAGQASILGLPDDADSPHVVFVANRDDEPFDVGQVWALAECVNRIAHNNARLTVLTHGANSIVGEETRPIAGALAGFARVTMTERPELAVNLLDLPLDTEPNERDLKHAILSQNEEESALRDGKYLALRLVRLPPLNEERRAVKRPFVPGEACELYMERPRALASFCYRPRYFDTELGSNEVEIEVEHVSLNFKDLVKATGALHAAAIEGTYLGAALGIEAAGRVVRAGAQVSHLQVGQRVVGFAGGAFATRLRVASDFVVPIDPTMDNLVASSLVVSITAWHALMDRAQLQPGEAVLIHSGSGGVGLAAIQVAQHIGARVFATAGTASKRDYLREMGVKHVYDSKSLDYIREIFSANGQRGVDVILNSLTGEHLKQSLDLVVPGGRFVELGKQDFAENRELGLSVFSRAISFMAIDLDRMSFETPRFFRPLAERVCQAFREGILKPLPTRVYSAQQIEDAFQALADTERVGKIVVDFTNGVGEVRPGLTLKPGFKQNASYLVIGGLGGFGLRTAEWLMKGGAGAVILASRRGELHPADRPRVERLASITGCELRCERLDATDPSAVDEIISQLASGEKPLRGIFHAAAALEDQPIAQLQEASLARVFESKARAAWNLHLATQHTPLDHFVLYSSISGWVGNPGQSAYAAANGYLDSLAELRRAKGLAATSVAWGAIGEVGMVARDTATGAHLKRIGFSSMPPRRALESLRTVLDEDRGAVAIADAAWNVWVRSSAETRWKRLQEVLDASDTGTTSRSEKLGAMLERMSHDDQIAHLRDLLRTTIAPVFKLAAAALDSDLPLRSLGMDSLIALELQAEISAKLGLELSTMELLAGRSVSALALLCLQRLFEHPKSDVERLAGNGLESSPRLSGILGDLRGFFLDRICVQPPYFSLEQVTQEGDWLRATVAPARPGLESPIVQQLAEAGRHMAILGSCAVRLHHPTPDGRVYYPVREARLKAWASVTLPPQCVVKARKTTIDIRASVATAETHLCTLDGQVLASFDVTYHIIPEAEFETLFSAHAQPTNEGSGVDPYQYFPSPILWDSSPGRAEMRLGPVDKERCLGHFVGYPAYPVSIMLRDIFATIDAAIQAEYGAGTLWNISGGSCHTLRFVFAGEAPTINAIRTATGISGEHWRCELSVGTEIAAWFDMTLAVQNGAERPGPTVRKVKKA